MTGAKMSGEPAVVAQEVEFTMEAKQKMNCAIRGPIPELYFCSDMKGYGWCFRKGDLLNVGLGRADPHALSAHVTGFLDFLKATGRITFRVPALHGHAYLLNGTSTRTTVDDGLLLVGDAAGLAHPQSGEGILPAIESGLLAAKSIVAADGSFERRRLEGYRVGLASRPQSSMSNAGRFLPSSWMGVVGRNLLKTQWFVRGVVLGQWFLGPGMDVGGRA